MPTNDDLKYFGNTASENDDSDLKYFKHGPDVAPVEPVQAPTRAIKRNTSTMGDFGTALKQGVQDLPGIATGIVDLPVAAITGKRLVSEGWDKIGSWTGFQPGEWSKQAEAEYSPQHEQSRQDIERAWSDPNVGKLELAGTYLTNPAYTAGNILQAIPSMVGGAGVGRAFLKGALPRAIAKGESAEIAAARLNPLATGFGEGLVTAGHQMDQSQNEDGRISALSAAGAGLLTGGIGTLGTKAAHKLGFENIESLMVGGGRSAASKTPASITKRVAGGAAVEGLIQELPQSMQEQVWQNFEAGRPLMEGVARAGVEGAIAGGVMGGGANILGPKAPKDLLNKPDDQAPAATTETDAETLIPPTNGQGEMFPVPAGPMQTQAFMDEAMSYNEPLMRGQGDLFAQQGDTFDMFGGRGSVDTPQEYPAPTDIFNPAQGELGLPIETRPSAATIPADHPSLMAGKQAFIEAGGNEKLWNKLLAKHVVDGAVDDAALQTTLSKKTRNMATAEQNEAALNAMLGTHNVDTTPVETSQADALAGQIHDTIQSLGKAARVRSGVAKIHAAAWTRAQPLVEEMGRQFVAAGGKKHVWSKLVADSKNSFIKLHAALTTKAAVKRKTGTTAAASAALNARVDEPGTTSTAFPDVVPQAVPEGVKDAVQERSPETEVSPADATGGTIPQSSEGVRQGEQGAETATAPEPKAEKVASEPTIVTKQSDLKKAESAVDTDPTDAQKAAGNYAKAHIQWNGLDIAIENPAGSERSGKDSDGESWSVTMPASYGYIKRTEGADGDNVDVYLGKVHSSDKVFVVDQTDLATGKFDEHKVMLGFRSLDTARRTYKAGFSDGKGAARIGKITSMSLDEFKTWLKNGDTTKPAEPVKQTKAETLKAKNKAKKPTSPFADVTAAANARVEAQVPKKAEVAADVKSVDEPVDVKALQIDRAGRPGFVEDTLNNTRDAVAQLDVTNQDLLMPLLELYNSPPTNGKPEAKLAWSEAIRKEIAKIENVPFQMRSFAGAAMRPHTVQSLTHALKRLFVSPRFFDKKIAIVQSELDLPANLQDVSASMSRAVQAYYDPRSGKVWMIAGNINKGTELAVALHEVGVHMGMRKLVGSNYNNLVAQIRSWAANSTGIESELAKSAINRVANAEAAAGEKLSPEIADEELLAYFVEDAVNAGIHPTAIAQMPKTIATWFRKLMMGMKNALRVLGIRADLLAATDIVNLAYGAANIELSRKESGLFEGSPLQSVTAANADRDMPKNIVRSFETMGKMYDAVADATVRTSAAGRIAALMPFTRDLAKWAEKHMPSAKSFWSALNARMATTHVWSQKGHMVAQSFLDLKEPGSQDRVQHYLFDGKMDGTWAKAHKPTWMAAEDSRNLATSNVMDEKWEALSAKERAVVDQTLKFFYESRKAHVAAVAANVAKAKRWAETLKTEDGKAELEADIASAVRDMGLWASYNGPYVPTMRFGDYYVEAKSSEYMKAVNDKDAAKIRKLKADPKHYIYAQFDTQRKALSYKASLKGFESLVSEPKIHQSAGTRADFEAILKLETMLRDIADKKGAADVRAVLQTLTRNLSDEYGEIQSRQEFKAVAGAKWEETMRGVALRSQQVAFAIGTLEHNRDISNAFFDMREQIKTSDDPTLATNLYNELHGRYYRSLDSSDTKASVQAVMTGVSLWKLMTNPMYYLSQLLQPFQYSIPYMTKYFGYGESWSAMMAVKESMVNTVAQSGVGARVAEDLSWVKKPKEKEMLEWLRSNSLLDMGIESEMGSLTGTSKISQTLDRLVNRPLRNAVQNTEIINRVATALAVYRLAIKNGMSEEKARAAVEDVISTTHGNYSGMNAPRFLNTKGWARIPVQFRKFQLIQATFLYKSIAEQVKRMPGATTAEKAAALRTITATLAHTAAIAGVNGLASPIFWLVATALAAGGSGGGEDDPRSLALKAHEHLSKSLSPETAELIMNGLPTILGVNISARSSVNPFSVLPFDNQSIIDALSSKKALQENAYTLLGGAAGGVLADTIDGIDMMGKGNWLKGSAMLMPSLPRNLMRSYQYGTEGMTQRNGDVMLTPEEFSWWDLTQQSMGAAPMKMQTVYWKRSQLENMKTHFSEKVARLEFDYVKARAKGDTDAMAEARQDWRELGMSMREVGITPPPISQLLTAPMRKLARERSVVDGIKVTPQTRRALQMME